MNKLQLNSNKYKFERQLVYLGFIVVVGELKVDQENVQVIFQWPIPCSMIEVWSFVHASHIYENLFDTFHK